MNLTLSKYCRKRIHLGSLNGILSDFINEELKFEVFLVLSHDHIELLVNGAGDQLFFRCRESQWMPTLRLYHKFPVFLPKQQVDKGAIRFVLSGGDTKVLKIEIQSII